MDAGGRVTQEQLPRRNEGSIASYVTGVARLPLNYRDVMNVEKAQGQGCPQVGHAWSSCRGAFSVLLSPSTYIPVGNEEDG